MGGDCTLRVVRIVCVGANVVLRCVAGLSVGRLSVGRLLAVLRLTLSGCLPSIRLLAVRWLGLAGRLLSICWLLAVLRL